MTKYCKRFELQRICFQKLQVVLYDYLEDRELYLSIYELVNLLNEVSYRDYSLKMLKEDICQKLDEVIE